MAFDPFRGGTTVDTFLSIALYSVLVLAGLGAASAAFVFLASWLSDSAVEPETEH